MRVSRRRFLAYAAGTTLLAALGCGRDAAFETGRYAVWGAQGARNGCFIRPRAIGVDRGEVYVIDTTGRVQVFTEEGTFLRMWSTPSSENGTPTAVAFFDGGARVVVPDTHYSRVLEYTPTGELIRQWGAYGTGDEQFIYPTGVAEGPQGEYFFSEYGMGAERVHVFDAERRFLRQWGSHGDAEGQLNRAMALAMDNNGTIYVADTANHRVQCFDVNGTFLRVIGGPGKEPGRLDYPYAVALGPDGSVFAGEYGANRVSRFTPEGQLIACYGRAGRNPGEFYEPRGVAVSPEGILFIADTENHRIQRIVLDDLLQRADPHQPAVLGAGTDLAANTSHIRNSIEGDNIPLNSPSKGDYLPQNPPLKGVARRAGGCHLARDNARLTEGAV